MNQTVTAARRHIADIESRITRQSALVERVTRAGKDTAQALRTLYVLQQALALTQEHVRILSPESMRERLPTQASADHPL
jgi:hypothetical protein